MISAILASTVTGGIGNNGTLPWPKHREDLAWFRSITDNNVVIMGRTTWNDPMMPKPLPNRVNFVVTSQKMDAQYSSKVNLIQHNITDKIRNISYAYPSKDIFIIGGKQLYESTFELVERIYWTRIKLNYRSDTRISLDRVLDNFRCKSVKSGTDCTYEIWDRISQ